MSGELIFEGVTPWPKTLISPGIMGWYAWVPGMQCYHGVVSLNHTIQGTLKINAETLDFSGGTGYTEKDWGKSFPEAWIWMQTNHFTRPGTCLTASAAIIPWRSRAFNGFIAGLWTGNHLYRFATYTGARIEAVHVTDYEATLVLADHHKRLSLTAARSEGGILKAPTARQMNRRITETLSAHVKVIMEERKGSRWMTVFNDTGRHAGLEVVGTLNL